MPLNTVFLAVLIGIITKTYAGGMGCLLHIFTFISEAMCRIVSRLAGGFFVFIGFLTKTYAGGMGCLLHIFTFISEAMCRIVSRLAGGFFVFTGF